MRRIPIIFSIILIISQMSCSTSVTRYDAADKPRDLSGKWNETDAQLVAFEMIADCIERPWHKKFVAAHGRHPLVRLHRVKNRSQEEINTNVFTKQIERALINSGKMEFRSKLDEIGSVKNEQKLKQQRTDFVLLGEVNAIADTQGSQHTIFYQVSMELHHVRSAKKVWIGEKQIKKFIKN